MTYDALLLCYNTGTLPVILPRLVPLVPIIREIFFLFLSLVNVILHLGLMRKLPVALALEISKTEVELIFWSVRSGRFSP
jgi:hypothetical protein